LTAENVFLDKIQGNTPFFERPVAGRLFEVASSFQGDEPVTVVVDSIDRLGRNLLDILKTIEIFTRNSINLKFLKEGE
jgi:DNA invertase Pin-like site-specific DNA recombinase